jgi:hypothetical protein
MGLEHVDTLIAFAVVLLGTSPDGSLIFSLTY